jgi:hypothetical protein
MKRTIRAGSKGWSGMAIYQVAVLNTAGDRDGLLETGHVRLEHHGAIANIVL